MRSHRVTPLAASFLAVLAVAMLAAPTAGAHKVQYRSTISILGFGTSQPEGPPDHLWGRVSSSRPKCVGGRAVTLKREISGQPFTVDTGLTSTEGFFSLGGESLELGGLVLVDKQRLAKKRKGHRHSCAYAFENFPRFTPGG